MDQDRLCVHYEMFKLSKILVKNTLASPKSEYYNKKIKASKENQRTVFSVMYKVLHKSQTVLPNNINSDKDMAHCFNNFFCQKILNMKRSSNTSCAVDSMPTWFLKDCLDVLISPITNIVNKSLSLDVFPRSMTCFKSYMFI